MESKKLDIELKEYSERENQSDKSLISFHIDISGFFPLEDNSNCVCFGFQMYGMKCILEVYLCFHESTATGSLIRTLSEPVLIHPVNSNPMPLSVSHSDGIPPTPNKNYGNLSLVEKKTTSAPEPNWRRGLTSAYGTPILTNSEPHVYGKIPREQPEVNPQPVVNPKIPSPKMEIKEVHIEKPIKLTEAEMRIARARYGTVIPENYTIPPRKRGNTNHYDAIPEGEICGITEEELIAQIQELKAKEAPLNPYDKIPDHTDEEEAS